MYDACDRLARRPLPDRSDLNSSDFEREARMYTAASKERDALSRLISVKVLCPPPGLPPFSLFARRDPTSVCA
jgi:hypothetical protein